MLEHVLVPLDGSRFAEFALSPALEIARRAEARLELLTVTDPAPIVPGADDRPFWTEERAGRYLEELGTALRADWDGALQRSLRSGQPAAAIQARAREASADLVVLSSHGRGPFSRFWLGSVADALVRRVECPVLVVRPVEGHEPRPDDPFRAERILVPVDGSEVSRAVIEPAVELGALFGARLHLVTCVPTLPVGSRVVHPYLSRPSRLDDARLRDEIRERRERMEALARRLRARDVETEVSVVRGEGVADGILRAAQEWDADLVAMGTRGRGGLRRTMLGSVADKVIRAASPPVLACRPAAGG